MDSNDDYILFTENKFIIHREFDNIDYIFGECDTISEAIRLKNQIDRDGWPISQNMHILNINNNNSYISEDDYNNQTTIKNLNLNNNLDNENYYLFDVKVGKAYKHKFLVLTRYQTYELLPKMIYEEGCEIVLDNIKAQAKLNFVPRIVIKGDNKELLEHLEKLSKIDPNQRKYVKLLRKEKTNNIIKNDDIYNENQILKEENLMLKKQISEISYKFNELFELINK